MSVGKLTPRELVVAARDARDRARRGRRADRGQRAAVLLSDRDTRPAGTGGSGSWIATAYGPPWDAENGSGITATGLNLTAGPPAYVIAVDPSRDRARELRARHPQPVRHLPARSTPAIPAARSSASTSTSTTGRAVAPRTPGACAHVQVTPAPDPGAGNLLAEITPTAPATPATPASAESCAVSYTGAVAADRRAASDDPPGRAGGRTRRARRPRSSSRSPPATS